MEINNYKPERRRYVGRPTRRWEDSIGLQGAYTEENYDDGDLSNIKFHIKNESKNSNFKF
jgi:hypothetical protein